LNIILDKKFKDVPNEIEKIYIKAHYQLFSETENDHELSIKAIERIYKQVEESK